MYSHSDMSWGLISLCFQRSFNPVFFSQSSDPRSSILLFNWVFFSFSMFISLLYSSKSSIFFYSQSFSSRQIKSCPFHCSTLATDSWNAMGSQILLSCRGCSLFSYFYTLAALYVTNQLVLLRLQLCVEGSHMRGLFIVYPIDTVNLSRGWSSTPRFLGMITQGFDFLLGLVSGYFGSIFYLLKFLCKLCQLLFRGKTQTKHHFGSTVGPLPKLLWYFN